MSARILKPQYTYHRLRIRADDADQEVIIVKGSGGRAYLWAGSTDGVTRAALTVSGRKALLALAHAILAEVKS